VIKFDQHLVAKMLADARDAKPAPVVIPNIEQLRFYLDEREDLIGRLWSAPKDKDGCALAPWTPGDVMTLWSYRAFRSHSPHASNMIYRFEPEGIDLNRPNVSKESKS